MTQKPTIFVVTAYKGTSHIESYWKECFRTELFSEWNVNVIDGQAIVHESSFWADSYYKFAQNKFLMDLFAKNKVRNGDIFVLTEALNYLVVPLTIFRQEMNLDIRVVGFWGDSLFKYRKNTFKWSRHFFFSIFNAFDLNCFPTEQHRRIFNWRFDSYFQRRTPDAVTGYPFSYLYERYQPGFKDDIIVFPWELTDDIQQKIFKGFQFDFPNIQFVLAQHEYNQRDLYVELLKKSKGVFWGGGRIVDPVLIFEAMCNAAIPFAPEKTFVYHDFPDRYYYNKRYLEPRMTQNRGLLAVRRRFQLLDLIRERLDSYNETADEVRNDAKEMMGKYYNSELFKQNLCQIL